MMNGRNNGSGHGNSSIPGANGKVNGSVHRAADGKAHAAVPDAPPRRTSLSLMASPMVGGSHQGPTDPADLYGDGEAENLAARLTELLNTQPSALPRPSAARLLEASHQRLRADDRAPRTRHLEPRGGEYHDPPFPPAGHDRAPARRPQEALSHIQRPHNDFADDDEMPPLPYAWRHEPPPEQPWLRRQLRFVAIGCITGMAIVVPAVLVMTGKVELGHVIEGARQAAISMPDIGSPPDGRAKPSAPASTESLPIPPKAPARPEAVSESERAVRTAEPAEPAASPPERVAARPPDLAPAAPPASAAASAIRARSVTTTEVFPTRLAPSPVTAPAPPPPVDPSLALVAEGQILLKAGNIAAARAPLAQAAAGGNAAAMLALAETFDPNMLAAWGAPRAVKPDVATARTFYARALAAGQDSAQKRLDMLR